MFYSSVRPKKLFFVGKMGAGRIATVTGIVILLVVSVIVGLMCCASSFLLSFIFDGIVEDKVNEVSNTHQVKPTSYY